MQPDKTLLYVPEHKETFCADIFVLAQMFAWNDMSPVIWLLSTIGLCTIEQPYREKRKAFRRFELVLATYPSAGDPEDPFPARLGVVLSWRGGSRFPGWNWEEVQHPRLVRWLALAGQELASWMALDGEHFAIPDTLDLGPGGTRLTRSILNRSALLPASPHMLMSGLGPFNSPERPTDAAVLVDSGGNPGTSEFEYGHYWMLPMTAAEHEKAQRDGTWSVFADLANRVPEGEDDYRVAFDLLRDTTG
ncbi:hypothetical protein LZC95_02260 [Pendulispora brunnea]|uniref:Uncharacterized protein n=1 Tax=Pendulispora brunnea TaxID=2905690 RepID=A0ABZ2KDM7_9BACT